MFLSQQNTASQLTTIEDLVKSVRSALITLVASDKEINSNLDSLMTTASSANGKIKEIEVDVREINDKVDSSSSAFNNLYGKSEDVKGIAAKINSQSETLRSTSENIDRDVKENSEEMSNISDPVKLIQETNAKQGRLLSAINNLNAVVRRVNQRLEAIRRG